MVIGIDMDDTICSTNERIIVEADKYDKEVHNRILELGFEDPVWDEKNNSSNIHKNISLDELPIMDVLIIE